MRLQLEKPIVFFDLETTGINPQNDRIVEMTYIKVFPDGSRKELSELINPQISIPQESTEIHGISNDDVASAPSFKEAAQKTLDFLSGCDLGGYNCIRFDIPMLLEEFSRCDIKFNPKDYRVIDAQIIFHKKESRTLSAALKFYCGQEHEGAHGAKADVEATIDVLEGQLAMYDDVPCNMDKLNSFCSYKKKDWIDDDGKLNWRDGQVVIGFGKMKGVSLKKLVEKNPGYLKWMLNKNFSDKVKTIVKNALNGAFLEKK
ncbi:MAG: 3'-5' exonuclease [Verrucomicrobiota bacterium]|nr:3'-5' exonuclease [Verrucomicrobiota bacterium]